MKSDRFNPKGFEPPGCYIFYIFLTALALRITFFALMLDFPLLYFQSLDETYYVDFGKRIAGGFLQGEGGPFFMDPFYGYFLGLIFFLFGDHLTIVRLLQILIDAFNIFIIFAISAKVWSKRAGMIAAIILATYTVTFYYTLLMLKTTIAISGMLLFTLFILTVIENQQTIGWFLAGIIAGVLTYIQANFILLVPLTIVFYYFIKRHELKLFLRNIAFFIAGALVLLSLNAIRNYQMTGHPTFLITQSGRNLYCCNNPENTSGFFDVPSFSQSDPIKSDQDFHKEAERRTGKLLSAKEVSHYWQKETFRVLIDNPRIIPVLIFNKLKWTIANYEIPMNQSYQFFAEFAGADKWPFPNYAFVIAFGLPGLFIGISRQKQTWCLLVPVLTILATLFIFCVSSRFRMPMVPFFAIGAGICLQSIWDWIKEGRWQKVVLFGFVSTTLFLTSMLISPPADDGHKHLGLAKAYYLKKDNQKAKSLAIEALHRYPNNVDLYILLGRIASQEGRLDLSMEYYQSAIKIGPDNFTAHYDLGMLYMDAGQPKRAIPYLVKSLTLRRSVDSMVNLAQAYEACGDNSQAVRYYNEFLKSAKQDDPRYEYAVKRLSASKDNP